MKRQIDFLVTAVITIIRIQASRKISPPTFYNILYELRVNLTGSQPVDHLNKSLLPPYLISLLLELEQNHTNSFYFPYRKQRRYESPFSTFHYQYLKKEINIETKIHRISRVSVATMGPQIDKEQLSFRSNCFSTRLIDLLGTRRYGSPVPESSQPGRVGDLGPVVGVNVGRRAAVGAKWAGRATVNRGARTDGRAVYRQGCTDLGGIFASTVVRSPRVRRRACRGRGSKTRLPSFPASLSPPPPGPSPSLHRKLLYQALFFQPSPRSSLKLAGNRPPHPSSSLSHFFSLSVRETLQGRNFCAGKTSRQTIMDGLTAGRNLAIRMILGFDRNFV